MYDGGMGLDSWQMLTVGSLMIFGGAIGIGGAVFEWNWFMNSPKAQHFVERLGRAGTRVFYALLGAALLVVGVLMVAGFIPAEEDTRWQLGGKSGDSDAIRLTDPESRQPSRR